MFLISPCFLLHLPRSLLHARSLLSTLVPFSPLSPLHTAGILPCTPKDHLLGRCDGNGMGACSSDWVVGLIQDTVIVPEVRINPVIVLELHCKQCVFGLCLCPEK